MEKNFDVTKPCYSEQIGRSLYPGSTVKRKIN